MLRILTLFSFTVIVYSKTITHSGNERLQSIIETDDVATALRLKRATTNSNVTSCTKEYQEFPGHTMCLAENTDAVIVPLSAEDKVLILDMHNAFRGSVNPPATDLMKLVYDEELAVVAEKWASHCIMGHDKVKDVPGYGPAVGQNVAGGYKSWKTAIEAWHDEVQNYTYGKDPFSYLGPDALRRIGHYTQIVCNRTTRVGCGAAYCENSLYGRYYVCNYFRGQSDAAEPYKKGDRCSSCPNSCVNGLCDCAGKTCFNGGTLNPDTCTCSCYKLYQGDSCEKLVCPRKELPQCGRNWPLPFCEKYGNVPYMCPFLCGICGDASQEAPNTTFVSEFGCKYNGKREDNETCKQFGAKGQDKHFCATKGGQLACGDCEKYTNVMTSYCPVMCGLCDAPCGGKQCRNGGKLSTSSCTCLCLKPYAGEFCEKLACEGVSDEFYCRFVTKADCGYYYNVPQECPYRCGVCPKI